MPNVNCTVYFRENGSSKIYSVEQAKGRLTESGGTRGNVSGRRSLVHIPLPPLRNSGKNWNSKKPAGRQTRPLHRKS